MQRMRWYLVFAAMMLILPLPGSALADPFGFFGLRSIFVNDYYQDVGIHFARNNLAPSHIFPDPDEVWDYKAVYDGLLVEAYEKNVQLLTTFMSPANMDKIRADYWRDFILRTVERYDGDADYGCIQDSPDCYDVGDNMYPSWSRGAQPAVKFWQMENEVDDLNSYWLDHPEEYAELVNIVYPLVKQACPDCTVLLGSLLLYDMEQPFYDVLFQNTDQFDALDFHRFGFRSETHFDDFDSRIDFLKQRYPSLPIWMTETSTYTDTPAKPGGGVWRLQPEEMQAKELLKRYVHFGSLGVKKIFWNYLAERQESSGIDDGVFWYTGLVYDGAGTYDKGEGVKKLSYFTYKLMVQKLHSADWLNITATNPAVNVFQYRFTRMGAPVYVAWFDAFNDPEPVKQVTLDVSDIRTSHVKVTKAVPRFQTGGEADAVPFDEAFESYSLPVTNGTILIELDGRPVYIEEEHGVLITDAYVTDEYGARKTDFLAGRFIQFHIVYDVWGDPSTQYKVKAKIRAFDNYYPEGFFLKFKDYPGTGFHIIVQRYNGNQIWVPAHVSPGTYKKMPCKLKLILDGQFLGKDKRKPQIRVVAPY